MFYKKIAEIKDSSYANRLCVITALTLLYRREFADMIRLFKYLHAHMNILYTKLGLVKVTSIIRNQGLRLVPCPVANNRQSVLVCSRTIKYGNKLLLGIYIQYIIECF